MYIEELELYAADLARLRAFYGDTLGLPLLKADDERLELHVGRSLLRFVRAPEGWAGRYHFAFNIPENQIAAGRAWLAERVALIADSAGSDTFPSESWNSDQIYFYDSAGNIGELIARHSLPNASDAPFGPSSLLSVSEIGLVVEDVQAAVARFEAELGLGVYSDSSASFAPLGDEHGLLILVPPGRIWFPETGVAAAPAPVRASLRVGDRLIQFTTEAQRA
jgi:catechol-2,3-dioxygenase